MTNERYAVLVPCLHGIDLVVERQLRRLEAMGVTVTRLAGVSEISFGRSQLASHAMLEGREAVLFIDSDILFNPADAIDILRRPEPIVAGVYPQKRYGKLNVDLDPGIAEIGCGTEGRDYEAQHVGAGFLRIRAEAFQRVIEHHDLPCCTAGGGAVWPFFLPMVAQQDGEWMYLGEDYAFCERARAAGVPIIVDTRIPLHHLGPYPYGWREAAQPVPPPPLTGVVIPHFRVEEPERTEP
jgi:hypothetical protein